MQRRQRVPRQWFVVVDEQSVGAARRLPRGSGVLVVVALRAREMRRLRTLAALRKLMIATEGRHGAARVHNVTELRSALLARTPMILLSPLYPTRSHPDWKPIARMRAAALARLGGRRLIALGGMDARKLGRISALGFQAWAGISAFRT
jgi:thiamine-phosphate pyrophosphorylase